MAYVQRFMEVSKDRVNAYGPFTARECEKNLMQGKGVMRKSDSAAKTVIQLLIIALVILTAVSLSLGALDASLAHPIVVLPVFGIMVLCWVWSRGD